MLCDNCMQDFVNYDSFLNGRKQRCLCCGRELISEIELCSRCREERIAASADRVFSIHSYALWKKDVLYMWKTEEVRVMSPFFARIVRDALCEIESIAGCSVTVVPVPPRPGKIRKYGWDQIEELCYYLKKMYGINCEELLVRYSKTQQKKLDRRQRLEMIENGYGPVSEKKLKKLIKGIPDTVVLIDDVLTTGSTAEACSKILKNMGVRKVFVLTIFAVN